MQRIHLLLTAAGDSDDEKLINRAIVSNGISVSDWPFLIRELTFNRSTELPDILLDLCISHLNPSAVDGLKNSFAVVTTSWLGRKVNCERDSLTLRLLLRSVRSPTRSFGFPAKTPVRVMPGGGG